MAQLSGDYVGGGNATLAWVMEPGPPRNDDASTRRQLSPGLYLVLACTEESSSMDVSVF